MQHRDHILIEHIISEKATEASSAANQYTFKVSKASNRVAVRQVVEKQFGVEVRQVRIINVKPKAKRDRTQRGKVGFKSAYKKAIVRLKDGFTIEMA